MKLNDPADVAAVMVNMGYCDGDEKRRECIGALVVECPGTDAEEATRLIDAALEARAAREAEMDRLVGEEAARAREAEHDTTKSMHDERGHE